MSLFHFRTHHENRRRHRFRAHHRQPGSALFFLMRDKGRSNRTVQALAMRVGLSITLFLLVLFAYKMGWIQPTGIR
jgi:hypothetical protein